MSTAVPPGPRGYPIVGVLPRIWRDPLRFFAEVAEECGDVARVGLGKFTLYLLNHPDPIQYVLVDNAQNYWKGKGLEAVTPVMGQGLASSEGELWQRQRKLMGPAFTRGRLKALLPVMNQAVDRLLDGWDDAARRGRAIDVMEEASIVSQDLIFRSLFGGDLPAETRRELGKALVVVNEYINSAAWTFVPIPESIPTPRRIRFRRALAALDRVVYGAIEERRRAPAERDDLLTRLLAASDEAGEGMTDPQVRDEVMTLFVAGHDTTAAAMAWTWFVLAGEPEARQRFEAEVAAGLSSAAPGADEINGLEYTERVLQEVMRLYPPAWVIVRTPYEDDTIGGFHIPAEAPLLISQWVVHRSPKVWPDPLRFDPDRFLPEQVAQRPRFAYFPYGGGRRQCIGKAFAQLAIKLVLARVAQRFEVEVVPRQKVTPRPLTTLRPRRGIKVRLKAKG